MSKHTWFLAAALVLSPVATRAQVSATGAAGAQAAATSPAAQARVDAALQTALDAGIPVALLERKIAEGKAKGVPMERIAAAVEARTEALLRAREAMARAQLRNATEGDLSVGADAVQAGVSDAALAEIARSAPTERRAVAIAVLTELVALGHAPERALLQVQTALRRGPEALVNLRAEAASQVQVRGPAGAGVQAGGGAGVRVEVGGGRRP
jgi:hypothetical protein